MATAQSPVSDMLMTVKSREIQRAQAAEMAGRRTEAERHFLAAAHLELVLAGDYDDAGSQDLAHRSRISAASCLWRGGRIGDAESIFEQLQAAEPSQSRLIQDVIGDLKLTSSGAA
jgi:hypothetical protein